MKNKEIVSEIVNDLRALGVDDHISERYVLSKLRGKNNTFLKRENDQLKLFYAVDVWTVIDCLEMELSNVNECTGIETEFTFMKSKYPIDGLYSYAHGPILRDVTSLDTGNIYHYSSLKDFKNIQDREFKSKKKYFWMRDNYLIIPDGPELLSLEGAFMDPLSAKKLSKDFVDACNDPMDENFACPGHLLDIVKQSTITDLFQFYKRTIKDELADSDTNRKTQQPNR